MSPDIELSVAEGKARLRGEARARRKQAFQRNAVGAAESVAAHLSEILEARATTTIAGYWAIGSEIDVNPLLNNLIENNWDVGLPVVVSKGAPLIFRRWRPGDGLCEGPLKTLQPAPDCPQVTPDIVLTPLLAFDDGRYRLGQGGGFYDRTLENLKNRSDGVLSIGVAFAAQHVERVPRDEFDQRLDIIVTEKGKF